jgi:glycosyltransferase involved in cell wall biosynthesis
VKKIRKPQFYRFSGAPTRLRTRSHVSPHAQRIVCIIATLNEANTIADVVRNAKPFVHNVVVVDGYSHDETCALARMAGSEVIYQEGKGKGMALRTAFERVEADIYVTIDGDATYDAGEMDQLIHPLLEGVADMVIGSRLRGKMEQGSISRVHIAGNRLFNFFINRLFGGRITDSQSGFRAVSRRVLECLTLSAHGFEIETELTVKALQSGFTILEMPITYGTRRGTASKLSALRDGARIMTTILSCFFHNAR